jgi:hypothetical protein
MAMRKTMAIGFTAAVITSAMSTGPATAADGITVVTFSQKTWKKLSSQMKVKPTGRTITINVRSFGFPAKAVDQDTVVGKGGLAFVRADASLTVKKPVLDLANTTVTATIVGVGPDYELFDLAKVKRGAKRTKAQLNLATGQAAILNQALKTDVFVDGMRIGTVTYNE